MNWRKRKEVGLPGIKTVRERFPRIQTGRECCCFCVIEIEHHRLRLGNEAPEKHAELVKRLMVQGDIVQNCDTGLEKRNRAVALVQLTDKNLALTDPGASKGRAHINEVLHIRAIHNRWTLSGAMQNPAEHADRGGLAACARYTDA